MQLVQVFTGVITKILRQEMYVRVSRHSSPALSFNWCPYKKTLVAKKKKSVSWICVHFSKFSKSWISTETYSWNNTGTGCERHLEKDEWRSQLQIQLLTNRWKKTDGKECGVRCSQVSLIYWPTCKKKRTCVRYASITSGVPLQPHAN